MPGVERFRAGDGQLFILVGAGRAADADAPYDLAIDDDRNSSDQRSEVFERRHHGAALAAGVDQFFKKARGLLEHDGGLGFADRDFAPAENVPSSRSRAIRLPPSSTTAMTPPGACSFLRFCLRGGNYAFRALQA